MSSNADEPPIAAGKAASRRPWPLSVLLTVATAVSSFVILAVVSVQMYLLLANHLKEQNFRYLKDEAETLGEMARLPGFRNVLANETRVEPVGEEYLTHFVRLLDKDGQTIIETPAMENILPRKLFPPAQIGGKVSTHVNVRGQNGGSYIVAAILIDSGVAGTGREVLQVGLDVTNVEKILAGYRSKLAVTLGLGLLICAVSGLLIARWGTRPIIEIAGKARQIAVSNLDERLSGADWPRELNTLADALNGMLDRIQDSYSRLYRSVANLTHKLRTPITIIRGEAEVALARERTAEELRAVIESSMEECGRLSRLVENIIFIAQAEAGKLHHVPAKIAARVEIDKILEFWEPLAEEKGIAVTCEGSATLLADPALFGRAVTNLLANALTFTPSGGAVVISIRQGDDGSAEVRMSDTGCGISEEEIPRIFDRFYRVYATRFMDPHGSGLGLPLVKTIMELHNGTIDIQSQPGQGTTVTLKFPPSAD